MERTAKMARVRSALIFALLICSLVFASTAMAKPAKPGAGTPVPTDVSSVTISVRSVTGRMVEGASVEIYSGHTKFTGTTDAAGVVTISGVPYGTYYLGIHHRLFCDSYYRLVVDEAAEAYTATAHPKSLWEGIGY